MRTSFIGIALSIACALSGCADMGNDPKSIWGQGFATKRIDDSTYFARIKLENNVDAVRNIYFYQCALLTLASGYERFLITPGATVESYRPQSDVLRRLPYGWDARDHIPKLTNPNEYLGTWWQRGMSTTLYYSSGVVSMFRGPLADSTMAAIDARKLKELMQQRFDPNTRGSAPELWKLIRQSTVTHVSITMPSADLIVPTRVDTPPRAGEVPATELRDASEFVDQFEGAEERMLYLFEQRRHSGAGEGGTVILSVAVLPDGGVSESRVVSSTVRDPIFSEGLRRIAGGFPFFREEVLPTRVSWYPVVFTPRRE
jgi:hypothetical protein